MGKDGIVRNSAYNMIKTMAGIIFPLITFPYVSRVLRAENVGKINFGNSIIGYIGLIASLGVSTYAIRACSQEKKNQNSLNRIASEIFSINMISTGVAYLVLVILLLFWMPLAEYRELILIQSGTILFTTLGADWINSAMEDFRYLAVRTTLVQLISLLAMFAFVHEPKDYFKYAAITVIAQSGGNIANIIYRRRFCNIHFTLRIDWKKHFPPIITLLGMLLAQQIFVNVDTTMLGIMKGDLEVGLYSTATKIYLIVNQMIASIAWVVMPRMSLLLAEKNSKKIEKLLEYVGNIIATMGVPCVTGMLFLATDILEIAAGSEYIAAATALRILAVALAFSLMGGFLGNIILLPAGKEKICFYACTVSAIANLGANFVLIPRFGMNAAACTTALSQLINLLISFAYARNYTDFRYMKKIIIAPLLEAFVIAVLCMTAQLTIENVYLRVIVILLLSAAAYLPILITTKNQLGLIIVEKVKQLKT